MNISLLHFITNDNFHPFYKLDLKNKGAQIELDDILELFVDEVFFHSEVGQNPTVNKDYILRLKREASLGSERAEEQLTRQFFRPLE